MKQAMTDLFTNPVFLSAAASWLIAQGGKVILDFCRNGFSAERLAGGGGMPSAHSATVTGLAVSAALKYGTGGFEFPMALFFAIVVIYDAMGVRYETGQEAKILNRMMERDEEEGRRPVQTGKLDEMMGHTLPQIIAGIAVGILCAAIVCSLPFLK